MKVSNETKVGIIAAAAITILILGYNFLKGDNVFSKSNTYYGVYTEVDGLFRSNPVILRGYKVGHVNAVTMDHNTLKLIVEVKIPQSIKLPKNSYLKITNSDLLGSKAVEIIMGDTNVFAISGDTLLSKKDAGMAQALTNVLSPLSEKVDNLLNNIDTAVSGVSLQKTLADLSSTLKSFKSAADNLDGLMIGKSEKLNTILGNLATMSADLKSSTPKINDVVAGLEGVVKELSKINAEELSGQLTETITEVKKTLTAVQEGQGTLGKLAKDDELWTNLNTSVNDLDSLVKDMIAYPRRYTGVFNKQRKIGDKQKEVNEGIDLPTETKP
ncbi:MAG: MCE family protein [Flavobacteriales bacterium]|nr:MCE family protein [Flavobacteriales bacterium]